MKTALTLLFILFFYGPVTAQDLPPDILADQYLLEATKALENGDAQAALRAFGKIEALDTEPPLEFLYFYGKLLVENRTALGDLLKGQSLLKQFVLNIDKDSEHYTPTLELLSVVGTKLEKAEARRQAELKALQQLLATLNVQMVHVQGGTFMMGCTRDQGDDCSGDERPAHRVRVNDFEISKYEVTQELWEAVTGENPSRFKNCPQCPVEDVSWDHIQLFLRELNAGSGRYRLPSEAEWEYAARGGRASRGYRYAGSNSLGAVAWYNENSGKKAHKKTHPVGQKQANELGLYDMSGNVWEWVQDCWNSNYQGAPSDGRAWEQGECRRVLRGGSWGSEPRDLRSANRFGNAAGNRSLILGFRLARSLP